jgi:hypothetical protein
MSSWGAELRIFDVQSCLAEAHTMSAADIVDATGFTLGQVRIALTQLRVERAVKYERKGRVWVWLRAREAPAQQPVTLRRPIPTVSVSKARARRHARACLVALLEDTLGNKTWASEIHDERLGIARLSEESYAEVRLELTLWMGRILARK